MEKRNADLLIATSKSLYELMCADCVDAAKRGNVPDSEMVGVFATAALTHLQNMLIKMRSPETLADYLRRVTPNFDHREPKRPLT